MSWCGDNGLAPAKKFFQRSVKGSAKVTDHFMKRLYQRFDGNERQRIIAEVYDLIKFGMYPMLFAPGEKDITVLVNNKVTVALTIENDRLVLKTLFERKKK